MENNNTWENWFNYIIHSIDNHEYWLINVQHEFEYSGNRITGIEEREKIREEQRKKIKSEVNDLELRLEKSENSIVSLNVIISTGMGIAGVVLTILGILGSVGTI